ncbi:MAG: hypothetical protein ACPGO3_15690 [Magnetospiraceae bacterium]
MMRNLIVGEREFPLDQDQIGELFQSELIYECGTTHGNNVHLDPWHKWTWNDVQMMFRALKTEGAL